MELLADGWSVAIDWATKAVFVGVRQDPSVLLIRAGVISRLDEDDGAETLALPTVPFSLGFIAGSDPSVLPAGVNRPQVCHGSLGRQCFFEKRLVFRIQFGHLSSLD